MSASRDGTQRREEPVIETSEATPFSLHHMIEKTIAPMARSDRKRAMASAAFYSECGLNRIPSNEAQKAASEVQDQYQKWWVDAKAKRASKRPRPDNEPEDTPPPSSARQADQSPWIDGIAVADHNTLTLGPVPISRTHREFEFLKEQLIENLKESMGDTSSESVQTTMSELLCASKRSSSNARNLATTMLTEGTWLQMTRPSFSECKGQNSNGEYLYSLGRLSFDMFRPTGLVCSIQGVYNVVSPRVPDSRRPSAVPFSLQSAILGDCEVRNYEYV